MNSNHENSLKLISYIFKVLETTKR